MRRGDVDPVDARLLDGVRRLLAGDRGAADTLDALLRPRLLRYFAFGPWQRHEAEDLVQKALTLVFTNMEQLQDASRFVPWLFAISRNVRSDAARVWWARNRREAGGLELAGDPPAPGTDVGPEDRRALSDRAAALREAVARLAPRQRQCLVLRVRDELSYEEIATTLRLSVHTVRNHIAQAKAVLRRSLAANRGETLA